MYFVLQPDIRSWRNRVVQAELVGERPLVRPHWWEGLPLIAPLPPTVWAVRPKAPTPDNFFTGCEFDLYSERLVEIIQQAGIAFEAFPASLVDHKTGAALPLAYRVFHMLELHPALDARRSIVSERGFERLVLTEAAQRSGAPLFRVEDFEHLILIRDDFKARWDAAGITGCRYTPIDQYRDM